MPVLRFARIYNAICNVYQRRKEEMESKMPEA